MMQNGIIMQANRERVDSDTSGVNYIFILGRSSAAGAMVTLRGYGSNNRRL
jgi:hypothetical protein